MSKDENADTRLDALEARQSVADEHRRQMHERLERIEGSQARVEKKLDQLLTLAAMGKGAWWLLTKVAGVALLLAGAVGWAADHFHWWSRP